MSHAVASSPLLPCGFFRFKGRMDRGHGTDRKSPREAQELMRVARFCGRCAAAWAMVALGAVPALAAEELKLRIFDKRARRLCRRRSPGERRPGCADRDRPARVSLRIPAVSLGGQCRPQRRDDCECGANGRRCGPIHVLEGQSVAGKGPEASVPKVKE
jgi:hypothetical protein